MHGFCGEVERPTFGYTVALSGTTVLGGLVYLADEKGIICSHDLSGLASVRARIPARSCVQQIELCYRDTRINHVRVELVQVLNIISSCNDDK